MRNLKKLFAVIMVVAMIASTIMVPALAAESFKYEEEALMLRDLNLFQGYSDSDTELGLGDDLTREQALALMIRVMGLDNEVKAMTDEEVAEYMAKVVDPETVTETWARPYVAYAVKNGLTNGIDASLNPNVKFAGDLKVTGKEFINFMLKGMGYQANWDDVLSVAAEVKMLTAGEAVNFGSITVLKRDDAVGIMAKALNAVTAEGITLAQALVNAGAVDAEKLIEYGFDVEVPGSEPEYELAVRAKKVNVLEAVFNKAVDTDNVTLTVKRGSATVAVDKTVWSEDKKTAEITTSSKLTKGTYIVIAKFADESEVSATVEIEDQKVAKIVILNDVALTNENADEVYVYYDVLDQYDQSMRTSASIEWAASVKATSDNRSMGILTLKKHEGDTSKFNYGDKIYLTGVYTKTGVSVSKELTVGMKQEIDSVEIVGFVKKGTTEILKSLPAGFKDKEYYMIYTVKDQNGNPVVKEVQKPVANSRITFITDNVLVIKEFNKDDETILTIDGVKYYAISVVPGLNVAIGGEVNVTAIANRTGNKSVKNIVVGEGQILKSFRLLGAKDMIADGESVEIEFEARDQYDNEIKNFVTLARQSDLNKLSFTASDGELILSENDDGTAKLVYKDSDRYNWSKSETTDGIDRPVSLTAIVVGGTTDNMMLYIQDKARPEAISEIKGFDNVLVEKGDTTVELDNIVFLDQYGRKMDTNDVKSFFEDANSGKLKGNEFAGYKFAVRATFTGDDDYFKLDGNQIALNNEDIVAFDIDDKNTSLRVEAIGNVTSSRSGFTLKFEIVKYKEVDKATSVSPAKYEDLTIVDIKAVSGFAVADLNKFFVETAKTGDSTGDSGDLVLSNKKGESGTEYIGDPVTGAKIEPDYKQTVKVTGKFGGKEVTIPEVYLRVESNKLKANDSKPSVIDAVYAPTVVGEVYATGFMWNDFYDATTARYVRKDAKDTLKVAVYELDKDGKQTEKIDVISKAVTASDEKPKVATIDGVDALTKGADNTVISIKLDETGTVGKYKILGEEFTFTDQYGVGIKFGKGYFVDVKPTFKVSSIVENEGGYVLNNFKVTNNDTDEVTIKGAERGDTFILTIKAGDITKTVTVTVGADSSANITNSKNNYVDVLINGDGNLEAQRQELLK